LLDSSEIFNLYFSNEVIVLGLIFFILKDKFYYVKKVKYKPTQETYFCLILSNIDKKAKNLYWSYIIAHFSIEAHWCALLREETDLKSLNSS
jgi:hypothetical protein